jgi:fibronectin-binding autotransporter adhesin
MSDAGSLLEIQTGTLLVTGTFTQSGGDTIIDSGDPNSPNTLHVTDAYAMNGGTLTVAQSSEVTADSGLTMTGGTASEYGNLNVTGQLLQEGGSIYTEGVITATGGLQISAGALLEGLGTIYADVTNAGTVRPTSHSDPDHIGWLTIGGNYSQTGTLEYQTSGPQNGSNLSIYGTASLGGTLLVTFLDGFVPQAGTEFFNITWWNYGGGSFDIVGDLPEGLMWLPTYQDPGNRLDLQVVDY